MKCKVCGNHKFEIAYKGKIRNGSVGCLTDNEYTVYRCSSCGVMWHETFAYNPKDYYESAEYREAIDGSSDMSAYYDIYDRRVLKQLEWTGTERYRGKVVADIGCAGGSFLDYLKGVSGKTIGIEPSKIQRHVLREKGHIVYDYVDTALEENGGKVDIATSFDVIEHITDPCEFISGLYALLNTGGEVIVGTPTDYPLLRKVVGSPFEEFMFDIQHPWIFSSESLKILFERAGFKNIKVVMKQQYGLGNFISWIVEKKPRGDIKLDYISEALDGVFRQEIIKVMGGDYLLVFAEK